MEVILGTANLGQQYGVQSSKLQESDFRRILQFEKQSPNFCIDTSPNYGEAENLCNKWVGINTKLYSKIIYKEDKKEFNFSKLRDFKYRIILIHNWEELSMSGKLQSLETLDIKTKNGEISGYGFSTYNLFCNSNILSSFPELHIQAPVNVLNQTNVKKLSKIKTKFPKTRILARSIFLQGILINESSLHRMKQHSDIKRFNDFCKKHKISTLQAALYFVLLQNFVDGLVLGVSNFSEWTEIIDLITNNKLTEIYEFNWDYFKSSDNDLIDPRRWKF